MKRIRYFFKNVIDKEDVLNQILDKISKHEHIYNYEKKFLYNYNLDYIKDYLYLSKTDFLIKVNYLIDKKEMICNLKEYNDKVIDVFNKRNIDFLLLESKKKCEVKDNYLYHINYIYKKDHFKLTQSDEFYEKLKRDDN